MLPGQAAASDDERTRLNNYEFLWTIGEGAFGKVMLAQHIPTGAQVAVKVIPKSRRRPHRIRKLYREVRSLKVLNHPNIVTLFEVIDTKESLFLILEYVTGGDMSEYMERHRRLSEDKARGMFRQLVSALHHCHQKGIVHRDLKPENILLDEERNVKLADFGVSEVFLGRKLSTYCGSVYYIAPEILQQQPYNGPPVDVWSLGIILYVMVTGHLPFPGDDFVTWEQQVLNGQCPLPRYLSPACRTLLKKMLTVNPRDRIALNDIMKDAWVNMGQEKLRPYREPPRDNRDPWVTEVMTMYLGFDWHKIQHSLRRRKYDDVMATYLILNSGKPKEEGHTDTERAILSMDPHSRRSLPACEVQAAVPAASIRRNFSEPGLPTWLPKADEQPEENQKSGLKAKEPASPLPSPEPRTTTPSSTPQHGPGAFPSTPGASNSSGVPGETYSLHAGQPGRVTPASHSGPSQGRQRAAGRFLDFISCFCFCLTSKKKHGKHNRIKPL